MGRWGPWIIAGAIVVAGGVLFWQRGNESSCDRWREDYSVAADVFLDTTSEGAAENLVTIKSERPTGCETPTIGDPVVDDRE